MDTVREYRVACRQCGSERPGTPIRDPGPGHWRCPRCKARNTGATNKCHCGFDRLGAIRLLCSVGGAAPLYAWADAARRSNLRNE
eukprot:11730925-Alexandrium_andersonii.AAC.1